MHEPGNRLGLSQLTAAAEVMLPADESSTVLLRAALRSAGEEFARAKQLYLQTHTEDELRALGRNPTRLDRDTVSEDLKAAIRRIAAIKATLANDAATHEYPQSWIEREFDPIGRLD